MPDIGTQGLLELLEAVLARFERRSPAGPTQPVAEDIRTAAFWLVQAELLALPAFGVQMLLRDLERLDSAEGAPADAAAPLCIDAAGIPGHVAMAMAVRVAAQALRAHGAAIVGIRRVGALGILGCAARSLAANGAVAIVSANSSAFVAPFGGTAPSIGTNPLAVAAPRADAPPLVIDYSTSPMTMAALREARASGSMLPIQGAFDRHGMHTTDPAQAAALVPEGRIASLTGLALELMTGVGVGGRLPAGASAAERSALVIAFAPAAMGNHDAAALCEQLAQDWQASGGHVPRRFDALALDRRQLPAAMAIRQETLDALRARR